MNTPQLKSCGLPLAAALIALATSATAATVSLHSYASPGQYVATPDLNPLWLTELGAYSSKAQIGGGFWTFCLETNQYFDQNGTYNVAFSNSTDGGSGSPLGSNVPDNISIGTAYLYELFAQGTLFSGGSYSTAQGSELQLAIWSLEDEIWSGAGVSAYLKGVLDAVDGVHSISYYKSDYAGSSIGVMNLTDSNGGLHQDQLVYHGGPPVRGGTVPDGGASLILLGISLGGLGIARRFSRA